MVQRFGNTGVTPSPRQHYPTRITRFAFIEVSLVSADTEYNWQLPLGLRCFTLQVRDGASIRLSFEMGKVAGSDAPYFTLKADNSWSETGLDIQDEKCILYMASAVASKTVEIMEGIEEE